MEKAEEIHDFWFQGITDDTKADFKDMPYKKWFMKSKEQDDEIKKRFERDLIAASEGKHDDWEKTILGIIALILLFDQFSRNIYRNSEKMFIFDDKSLALTNKVIDEGQDKDMMLIERTFLYLPLEHSEDITMQEKSLSCFQSLVEDSKKINPANSKSIWTAINSKLTGEII